MPKAKKKSVKRKPNLEIRLSSIEKNQKEILRLQQQLLARSKIIQHEEEEELKLEKEQLDTQKRVESEEIEELLELKKLKELEESIKKEVKVSPLGRITRRDISKSIIGAFIGIVSHFAFAKGVEISAKYSYVRSSFLFFTAFIVIILFLYFAGFRKINDTFIVKILPLRAVVIYLTAIVTIVLVLLLYGKIDFTTPFHLIYNTVAAVSILAVLGAGTADLIGKVED